METPSQALQAYHLNPSREFCPRFPQGNPHPAPKGAAAPRAPPGGLPWPPAPQPVAPRMGWPLPRGTGCPAGVLAARCLRGQSWLGALFYVLFILPRETEEFSVQESRVLALLPRRMKAAEQTGENQRRLRPAGFPHRRPRCQLLHKLGPGLSSGLFPRKPSSKDPAAVLSPLLNTS